MSDNGSCAEVGLSRESDSARLILSLFVRSNLNAWNRKSLILERYFAIVTREGVRRGSR